MCKSLHYPTDNHSNTINTTPTVSIPNNTPVCQNYDVYILLLSEGIGSLEQSFDTQLRNFRHLRLNPIARKQTLTTSLIY